MLNKLLEKVSQLYYDVHFAYDSFVEAYYEPARQFENALREVEFLKEKVVKLEKELETLKKRVNMNSIFGSN